MQETGWVAVALDNQVPPRSANPAVLHGEKLAVWRGSNNQINIWENRCPHRGMPLSFGFVEGDTLRCLYHGWGFGTDGQCKSIPAHPDLTPPQTIRAKSYGAQTRYGVIWANMADTVEPSRPDFGDDQNWLPVRSIFLELPAADVIAALSKSSLFEGATPDFRDGHAAVVVTASGLHWLLAVQPVNAGKTGLHVAARRDRPLGTAERIALARRIETFRNTLTIER